MHFSLLLLPLCSALTLPGNPHAGGHKYPSAKSVIKELNLQPSSEKGYFIQTFQDPVTTGTSNRSASTAIYYLLEGASGHSLWHKLDAAEVWHYYAGAPLILSVSKDDGSCVTDHVLGSELFNGQRPQAVVDRGEWQRSRSLGEYTLVGTTGNRDNTFFPWGLMC